MSLKSNGKRLWLLLTLKADDLNNAVRTGLTKLRRSPLAGTLLFVLSLFALAMLLASCATPSTLPTEPARNPKPPQLSEPLPSESYLQQAQKLIESWRNAVTGM